MRTHVVRQGDTLSGLAKQFSVPVAALIRVNKKQSNPDLIRVGETLKVPQTKERYDRIIKSLEELSVAADHDHRDWLAEVGAVERESGQYGARVDLAADVMTCFVGAGKAVWKYGGVVRTAAVRKKLFEVAQKVLMHAASEAGMSDAAAPKIVLESINSANADQFLRGVKHVAPVDTKQYGKALGKSAAEGTVKAVSKDLIKTQIAVEKQLGAEMLMSLAITAAFNGLDQAVAAISPSNLAQFAIKLRDGEDLATTLERSRRAIGEAHRRTKELLTNRILLLRSERIEAYG